MTLPKHHHPHDRKWITEQLARLPPLYRERAAQQYSKVFAEVFHATELRHKKHNKARREANTRLREYVSRVLSFLTNCNTIE